jgi:hypothetical protein
MILLYNDLVKSGTLTASSEATGHPASNVQHVHLSRTWRSDTDAAESIVIDFGAAVSVDAAAIVAHNLTSAAVARIEANSSDSWTTPPFTRALNPDNDPALVTFSAQSYQYWRFYFDDGSNPDAYIEVGRLFLCVCWTSIEPVNADFVRSLEDTTKLSESISGQVFADIGVKMRTIKFSLGFLSDDDRVALEAAVNVVGQYEPVIVCAHEKVEPLYARLTKLPTFSQVGALNWRDDALEFKEAM